MLNGSQVPTDSAVDALATTNGPFIYDLSPGVHPKSGSMVFLAGLSTTVMAQTYLTYLKSGREILRVFREMSIHHTGTAKVMLWNSWVINKLVA